MTLKTLQHFLSTALKSSQLTSKMSLENNFTPGQLEGVKNWCFYRKYQLIFGVLSLIGFIVILSVHGNHHDAKVSELQDKIKGMQSKFKTLESTHKQELAKLNMSLTNDLAKLNMSLTKDLAKISSLLTKQYDSLLENDVELQGETEKMALKIKALETERITKLEDTIRKNAFHSRAAAAQSCQELYDHGFRQDGYYWIDPDGRYQGNIAFEVYCKNLQRSRVATQTIVPTNTDGQFEIFAKSQDDFKFPLKYKPSMNQLKELTRNSGFCYQAIKVECHMLPLHFQENNHGYWLDNNGTPRYFFDGAEPEGRQCECSANSGYCQGNHGVLCNCDLRSKFESSDKGFITAQWLLPIQEFGYKFLGHSLNTFDTTNGTAKVTIGDLICKGKNQQAIIYHSLPIFSKP